MNEYFNDVVTDYKKILMDFCEELDDDIFLRSCELYEGDLNELDKTPSAFGILMFRKAVSDATCEKIYSLSKYLI